MMYTASEKVLNSKEAAMVEVCNFDPIFLTLLANTFL